MSDDRLAGWPSALRAGTTLARLGPAPGLVVHPDGRTRAPVVLWLHGRTVSKEIDSARYRRLQRAGIAVAAIDLPGHGERHDPALHEPDALGDLLAAARAEVDDVVAALGEGGWADLLDLERAAIGGVSAGGMVTLRRLGEPHGFVCAAVESTAGDLAAADPGGRYAAARARGLDPRDHLAGWRPIPLLALHSEADALVPVAGIRSFVAALEVRYAHEGADAPVRLHTWPETGAPREHLGFGRKAAEARRLHVRFLRAHLLRGDA